MLFLKIYMTFVSALLGAVMGSFLNCWAMRWEQGEKYPRGRSHCPKCGHTLSALELIPVLSYLIQRGRCRACSERISPRYPATELIGAAAFAAVWLRFGFDPRTAELMLLTCCLMFLSIVDFDVMLLPDGAMLTAALIWAAFLPLHDDWKSRALGGVVTGLVLGGGVLAVSLLMDKLLGRESLGGGDVKLLALMGLYTGPWKGLLAIILACFIGLAFAFALKARDKQFPFGPAICAAAFVTLLAGDPVVEWYLGLF